MRDDLTIGEVAKLLDISTYNLRYYQKEGLVSPSGESESGYRLFNIDDVIHIKCIMLLRESGISIKEIQKLLDNYNKDNYIETLNSSLDRIMSEIERLSALKVDVESTLRVAQNAADQFSIRNLDVRTFLEIKKSEFDAVYSAKEIFDITETKGIEKNAIITNNLHYILYDNEISMCVPTQCHKDCVVFNKGKYLCYEFMINDYNDPKAFDDKINEFVEHMTNYKYRHESELLFIVHLGASLITENGFCGELQIKIK